MTRESKGEGSYAPASDFCRIFQEDMSNLYSLALLLTADSMKAEECFVSGLERCSEGSQVFKEWARSWARRAIIKGAIRLVTLDPASTNPISDPTDAEQTLPGWRPELRPEMSAVLGLPPLERFAFVASVLEGYNERDSALLLGCTQQSLIAARSRALRQIANRATPESTVPSVTPTLESPVSLAMPA